MRVVGASGIVMDLDKHVATGLLASGVVTRVKDTSVSLAEVIPPVVSEPASTEQFEQADLDKHIEEITATAAKLSDVLTGEDEAPPANTPVEIGGLPAGNASRDAWEEFALANGKTEDDLMGLNRDAIRALFTSVPADE